MMWNKSVHFIMVRRYIEVQYSYCDIFQENCTLCSVITYVITLLIILYSYTAYLGIAEVTLHSECISFV